MPAGPQLAATKMTSERKPLSVRFIRAEAGFCECQPSRASAGTRPTESLSEGHVKVAANCSLRPDKPDGRPFELETYGTKTGYQKHMSIRNFNTPASGSNKNLRLKPNTLGTGRRRFTFVVYIRLLNVFNHKTHLKLVEANEV